MHVLYCTFVILCVYIVVQGIYLVAESLINVFKYDEVYIANCNEFADAYINLGDFID